MSKEARRAFEKITCWRLIRMCGWRLLYIIPLMLYALIIYAPIYGFLKRFKEKQ